MTSPAKRSRMESMEVSTPESSPKKESSPAAALGGGGGGNSSSGGGGALGGNHMFPPKMPLKHMNKYTKTFTKHFYFKIYANDWSVTPDSTGTRVQGFMTYIPYQALCMYLAPEEYMKLVRDSNYCKIKEAKCQVEFKAVRTPFMANSTDTAEANGNLQFEIQRFDGLEKMLPFQVNDVPGRNGTPISAKSYAELIQRLYGYTAFGRLPTAAATARLPATMRERGLSWRPSWQFSFGASFQNTGTGSTYRDVNKEISSLPIGEYITDRLNTNQCKMGEGYCFNKVVRPKNGIITSASSAFSTARQEPAATTRINMKQRMRDPAPLTANPLPNDPQYAAIYPIVSTTTGGLSIADPNKLTGSLIPPSGSAAPLNAKAQFNISTGTSSDPYYPVASSGAINPPPAPPLNFSDVWNTTPVEERNFITDTSTITGSLSDSTTTDNFGYGYNNDMSWYALADLENYSMFTSRNEIPIHHMPSFMIGAVPKTNMDNSIVNATMEFEVTTAIEIECSDLDPTYINCAYDVLGESVAAPYTAEATRNPPQTWIDSGFAPGTNDPNNGRLFGGKWQHNELDVMLRDPKFWNNQYGRAGKPLFELIPNATPNLSKYK